MRFTKIGLGAKEKVELLWTSNAPGDEKTTVQHILETDKSPPHPDFRDAMTALLPLAMEVLEIPDNWRDTLTVVAVNFSEDKNGRHGTILTVVKRLTKADGTVVMNTPLIRSLLPDEDPEDLPDTWLLLTDTEEDLLTTLRARAEDYVGGKRQQGDLFDQPAAGTPAAPVAEPVMPTAAESRRK